MQYSVFVFFSFGSYNSLLAFFLVGGMREGRGVGYIVLVGGVYKRQRKYICMFLAGNEVS